MSYSFLLVSGSTNNPPVPVGASYNGKVAVLHRKNSSLNSNTVANGRAVFTIPAERVLEFAGSYTVTIDGNQVQDGDINILRVPSTGGTGGGTGTTADLTNYFTKPEIISQISSKTDKSYVDTQLNLKANDASLTAVARTGSYADLAGKPDLTSLASVTALNNGLAGKVNTATYTAGLAAKADAVDVNTALSAKADAAALTSGLATKVNTSTYTAGLAAKADSAVVYEKTDIDNLVAARARSVDVYSKAEVQSLLAAGSGGGGTITLLQKSNGYCPAGSTTPVTAPAAGYSYVFQGIATPPFNREQDLWLVIDRGITATPVTISLLSSDDFDSGKNLATPAVAALDSTRWGGETGFFRQSSAGEFVPTGWTATSKTYFVGDKTTAVTPKMRVEFRHTGYSSTTTQRTLRVWVNVTDPNVAFESVAGYGVMMDTTSGGTTENWTVARLENGTNVGTLGTITQARASAPRNVVVDSDGKGGIKVTVDGVVLNGGNAFVDPSTTPLTGKFSGLSGYNQSNSASASMNAKGDVWRFYG
jgi:hypothetical protein